MSVTLTLAGGGLRVMEVEPDRLGFRYTAASGENVSQVSGLTDAVLLAWMRDAGVAPTEQVQTEAHVVMSAVRTAVASPRAFTPQLGGVFSSGGGAGSWSDVPPASYDLPPILAAILLWLSPVLYRQWRWHWTFLISRG